MFVLIKPSFNAILLQTDNPIVIGILACAKSAKITWNGTVTEVDKRPCLIQVTEESPVQVLTLDEKVAELEKKIKEAAESNNKHLTERNKLENSIKELEQKLLVTITPPCPAPAPKPTEEDFSHM